MGNVYPAVAAPEFIHTQLRAIGCTYVHAHAHAHGHVNAYTHTYARAYMCQLLHAHAHV